MGTQSGAKYRAKLNTPSERQTASRSAPKSVRIPNSMFNLALNLAFNLARLAPNWVSNSGSNLVFNLALNLRVLQGSNLGSGLAFESRVQLPLQ